MSQVAETVDDLDPRYRAFTEQRFAFLAAARAQFPESAGASVSDILTAEPQALTPVLLNDVESLSEEERYTLASSYWGPDGVAHFAVARVRRRVAGKHFVLAVANQLADQLPLAYPVTHPMEEHTEARERFGAPDGTLKLYNLPIPEGVDKYREQAETNELFAAHNDGLGYGGAIASVIFALDSPPAWGGYTCFLQLVRVVLALANDDPDAFESLFLPDAIVAIRPRGKGAIRVTSPVLYVNDRGEPQVFLRNPSGEYRITWRSDIAALRRARALLVRLAQPFAPSSSFVHLMHPGEGVIIRNPQVVHSRTPFTDDVYGTQRVIARKWFVVADEDTRYKHVPGMNVAQQYASLFPELFAPDRLTGEWHFDPASDDNLRIR